MPKRWGLTNPVLYESDEELARAALESDHPALQGITLETLKQKGWARLNWPRPYQPFLKQFFTPSGKFEFASERGEADGVGRFPKVESNLDSGHSEEKDALTLFSPGNKRLLNSVYGVRERHAHADAVTIALHRDDIQSRNLKSGTRVRVWNQRGGFEALLVESEVAQPGIAVCPKGLWPKFNRGASVNATIAEQDADMGRGAIYNDNRVFVEALETEAPQAAGERVTAAK